MIGTKKQNQLRQHSMDMTQGSITRQLISFAFPLLIGNLFQQLYNMADGIIVGQFIGTDAFAAVGATGSMSFLIIGFILGCSSGFCIPVSQYFGAKDDEGMRRCVANIMTVVTMAAMARPSQTMLATHRRIER